MTKTTTKTFTSFDIEINFLSLDVSNKQFPKQQKRRESSHQTSENNKSQSSKNRSTNFYDKRPQRRNTNLLNDDKSNTSSTSSCSSTGLMEDAAELNSVFNHGSKKQNLNHLLNFHYYNSKDNDVIRSGTFAKHGYHRLNHSKRYNFNKEQYLQANCQFVVKADTGFDYRPFKISPDNLVQWDQVVKILVSSVEEAQCPICLYPPKAAKVNDFDNLNMFTFHSKFIFSHHPTDDTLWAHLLQLLHPPLPLIV